MSKWQPIDTAPRDGTWFLGYRAEVCEQDRVQVYRWYKAPLIEDCFWQNAADSNEPDEAPSHWQPMLSPPT